MRLLPLALLLALAPEAAAIKVQPPPDAPRVLVLSQSEKAGDSTSTLALYDGAGVQLGTLLDQLPLAGMDLLVHADTGRWVLTYHQLSNGDPLKLDGKAVSKPDDRNTLVFGDLAGVVAATYGDKACTNKKKACFETPLAWSADGAYVYVRSLASSWGTTNRWSFGAKPKLAAITAKKPGALTISPDLTTATYIGKDGVHVLRFPKPAKKPKKLKATKKAVVSPDMLFGEAWPINGKLYWFRREPTEQKRGWFEQYDPATKTTTAMLEAKADYYLPRGGFVSTRARGTVLFGHDSAFERADLYEFDGTAATLITKDVLQLLDVSADGRFALVTKRKDPPKLDVVTNPEHVVIVDLVTHREVARIDTGGDGRNILGAAFVSAP